MPNRSDMFGVVDASPRRIVLRVIHDCSGEQFLRSLPVSQAVRRRFAAQGVPEQIRAGSDLVFALEETRTPGPLSDVPVQVLWYDRFALVANKPCGLLVHSDGTASDTLTARVQAGLARAAADQGWPFVPVAQAVNRLDVDTSGLVLFSLTQEFQPAFDGLMAKHYPYLHKRYLAVVEGIFLDGARTIDAPIARDRHRSGCMRVGPTGKAARTQVCSLEHAHGRTLVACELLSGRRHQIRVHLAHAGHPVVGDTLYGRAASRPLMLHAAELEFWHPLTHDLISIVTDWPQRFAGLFAARTPDWSILGIG